MGLPADDGSRAESPTVEETYTPSNENDKSEDVDMGYIGCLTPQVDEVASELILMAIGSTGRTSADRFVQPADASSP